MNVVNIVIFSIQTFKYINHLSESLRQIAASREQPGESQKMPDDLELIRNSIPAEEMALLKTLFNTLI